jgi:gamma-glutamylcyclotransferase
MRYAAYGSNLHPLRLQARTPSSRLLGTSVIGGRALRFHKRSVDGSGKCNVVPTDGEVHVAVYEIAAEEKPRLDAAEGVGYCARTIDVAGFGECFIYIADDSHIDDALSPYSWYRELVLMGCEYLEFPQRYIDGVSSIESHRDPDFERHTKHMAIVREARSPEHQGTR